jgi:Na+/H+-dicarboxylate symporter
MIRIFKNYTQALLLLGSVLFGGCLGSIFGHNILWIKPLGEIFLNLLLMIVVPLVFFSISSSVAQLQSGARFRKIIGVTLGIFFMTSIISAIMMLYAVSLFPPGIEYTSNLLTNTSQSFERQTIQHLSVGEHIVRMLTVQHFMDLFKRENMLPLIVFSICIGFASRSLGAQGEAFRQFLNAASAVCMKFVEYIMYYAPIGLTAYFAVMVAELGPSILNAYARVFILYLIVSLIYFIIGFSIYAWLCGGNILVKKFWYSNILPSSTAIATQSSMATIPSNLEATRALGISREIQETVIPLGASMHKDGSAMGAILKIAFIFGIAGLPFEGIPTFAIAIGLSLVTAVIMGGIPGGGLMAEMFILSAYGLPPEYLPLLAIISTIIDVPATLLNATGDNIATIMVARIVDGKDFLTTLTSSNSKPPSS